MEKPPLRLLDIASRLTSLRQHWSSCHQRHSRACFSIAAFAPPKAAGTTIPRHNATAAMENRRSEGSQFASSARRVPISASRLLGVASNSTTTGW
jgi:hypothetical protein